MGGMSHVYGENKKGIQVSGKKTLKVRDHLDTYGAFVMCTTVAFITIKSHYMF